MTVPTLPPRPRNNTGDGSRVRGGPSSTSQARFVRQDGPNDRRGGAARAPWFAMRLRLLLWAFAVTAFAVASLALFIVMVTGVGTVVVWVGLPLLYVVIRAVRPIAAVHRRYVGALLGTPIESPYIKPPAGNLLVRLRAFARDPATRRDAMWLTVNATVGLLLGLLGVVEGLLDLLFWWLPRGVFVHVHAHLSRALLAPN